MDMDGDVIKELLFYVDCASMGFLSNQGGHYRVGVNFPILPFQSFVYIAEGEFETAINIKDLPSGMYLITLTSAEL